VSPWARLNLIVFQKKAKGGGPVGVVMGQVGEYTMWKREGCVLKRTLQDDEISNQSPSTRLKSGRGVILVWAHDTIDYRVGGGFENLLETN